LIKGFANRLSTKERLIDKKIPIRETPWFYTSPVAIGTHLGEMNDADSALYQESITYGLRNGINFLDTALNYRGMRSERDVGKVLNDLIANQQELKREEIVVSTKAGIIPGDIDKKLVPTKYLEEILIGGGVIQDEDVNIVDHHRHTMAPSYFQFAIEESRKHLNLDTIDIYYLHNPEISMMVLGHDAFYSRLTELFAFFEEMVTSGAIRFYGIATWSGLLVDPEESGYLSLEKVIDVARKVAGEDHHCRFIQFPFNQTQQAGKTKLNQQVNGKWLSVLDAANELGLQVTTSAPFNLGKALESADDARLQLIDVLGTDGILAAMVGMRRVRNVERNLRVVRELK
jgi:predicted aldo/keto reductase-like oxidoreductase